MKRGDNQGITLIGLMVTIIVLFILAGVAIGITIGEQGILKRVEKASEKNLFAFVQEKIGLVMSEIQLEFWEMGKPFDRSQLTQSLLQQKDENISNFETENFSGIYTLDEQAIGFIIHEDFSVALYEPPINGATIAEVDDIRIWLECANLQDEYDYNTMEQVLANGTCLQQLMNSRNAVDYMVRSNRVIMPAIVENQSAIVMLSKNKYAGYKAVVNQESMDLILASEMVAYFDENSILPQKMQEGNPICNAYGLEYVPENAFDGTTETQWWTDDLQEPYIGYDFMEPVNVYKIVVKKGPYAGNTEDYYVKTGHIQYSDDGNNWVNVNEEEFETTEGKVDSSFKVNAGSHRYWRITCESTRWRYEDQVSVGELEMYSRCYNTNEEGIPWADLAGVDGSQFETLRHMVRDIETMQKLMSSTQAVDYMLKNEIIRREVIQSEEAMTAIGKSDYAARKVLTDDTWQEEIFKSSYGHKIDENSILPQKMEKGQAICNAYGLDYVPQNAFDGTIENQWWTDNLQEAYIGYDFTEPVNVYKIVVKKGQYVEVSDYYVRTGHIQYSDDGENWVNVSEEAFETTEGKVDSSFMVNAGSHRYWRITCESNRWHNWDQVSVGELELYARIF